jgi:flagellar motor switch protein FliG
MNYDIKTLKGPEKAAILVLCLGEELGSDLLKELAENEIFSVSQAMAGLGMVQADVVEDVLMEFAEGMTNGAGLIGSMGSTEALLERFLDSDRVAEIMKDVRGPVRGKNLWERFSSLNESQLASFLKGENPQAAAAILSMTKPETTSKILPLLSEGFRQDVIERLIKMDSVPRDVLEQLEDTLEKEFITPIARTTSNDPIQNMADVFNKLDPEIFLDISKTLDESLPEEFQKIKNRMFTFDDLIRLDLQSVGKILRTVSANSSDTSVLPTALKGAKKDVRDHLLAALPERSRNMLVEEMDNIGAIRKKDSQDAQSYIVDTTKMLSEDGTIQIPSNEQDEFIE